MKPLLVPGTRLGPYEILQPLGAGGMGEVYKAKDGRLGRHVAVKVLPGPLANDRDALSRFEREARAVAALNHPNILGIHDFATDGQISYVVMELLEGESLRARIESGPLTPSRATRLAVQMAEGLAAAHEKGVVHRDLKPDNLWVTKEGRLKILDFGLAKRVGVPGPGPDSLPPTVTFRPGQETETGTILGTLGYMSPEQVRGEPVDGRSDIFSFGVVLFEMLTGRRTFARDSATETIAAILRDDPQEELLAAESVPHALRRLILHCLEKDVDRRFQSAVDLAFALETALSGSTPGAVPVAPPPVPKGRSTRSVVVVGSLCLALGAGLAWVLRGSPEPASAVAIRPVTYSGHDTAPAAGPDGTVVAFTSDRDGRPRIWLKQLKGGGEMAITDGPDDYPRFSPDGTAVLFVRFQGGVGSLHRIALLGDVPHKIVENAEQGDWSPDGKQIAFVRLLERRGELLSALFLIDAAGGAERELARFRGELVGFPRWSPDGRRIVVNTPPAISSGVLRKLIVVDVTDGSTEVLRSPQAFGMFSSAAWASADEIVYLQAESITGGGTAVSAARAYLQNVNTQQARPLFWVASSGTIVDLLPDGRVIFDSMSGRQNLREYALDEEAPPRWVTRGAISDRQPTFAPADGPLVFSSNRSGNLDLWAISTGSGIVRSITDDPADDWDPAFSPDGRSLLWSSNRSGNLEVWASNVDGTGAHQVTHNGEDAQNPTQGGDGTWIIYASGNREHPGLWKVHPDGTGSELLVSGAVQLPQVSPDGRYATYVIVAGVQTILHVIDLQDGEDVQFAVFPELQRKIPFLRGRARWTPDGKRILYTGQDADGRAGVFIQEFVPGEDTSATRRRLAGFGPEFSTESLGLSSDGTRLMLSESEREFTLMIAEGIPHLRNLR